MSTKDPMTLNEVGEELAKAAEELRSQQPKSKGRTQEEIEADAAKSHANMMAKLRRPVGSLKSK
jgi:hypothetical protein